MLMIKGLMRYCTKTAARFFVFRENRGIYEAGFVVLIWRHGADFWRRLAGPEKLRWNMHGLSMRVSG